MVELKFPCDLSTEEMTPSARGFLCHSCDHEVIDFTTSNSSEIKSAMSCGSKVCGVFRKDQLRKPETNRIASLFKIAIAVVFILGLNSSSFAQETSHQEITDVAFQHEASERTVINGMLKDVRSQAIANATVELFIGDRYFVCRSDENGKFSFKPDYCPTAQMEIRISAENKIDKNFELGSESGLIDLKVLLHSEHQFWIGCPSF